MHERCDVLIVRSSRRCTGLERRLLLYAQAARSSGLDVRIAVLHRLRAGALAAHPLLAAAAAAGIPAQQIPDPGPASPATERALRGLLKALRPRVVHSQDYRSDFLAWLACRWLPQQPILLATCHGHTGATARLRLYEALDRRLLSHFGQVIGVSQEQCRQLRAWGVPAERVIHMPHPVEPGWAKIDLPAQRVAFREALGIPPDAPLVGFFGRPSPEKGWDLLQRVWPNVCASLPAAGLLLTESSLPGAAGVWSAGYQEDLRPALAAVDLVAAPSRREAFGLIALEALALGRPVLAADVGGLRELIHAGETGCLVPAGDPQALIVALLEQLGQPAQAAERAERGRLDVQSRYAACQIVPRMVGLYTQFARGTTSK